MNQFAKRLQSRLSAKGHRFSMEQCRQAISINAENPEAPTEAEMLFAFNQLTKPIPTPKIVSLPDDEEDNSGIIALNGISGDCLTNEEAEDEDNDSNTALSTPPSEAALTIADSPKPIEVSPGSGGITQAEITEAITQAVAQVGASGNAEAIELLTSLANELSTDIKDVEEMASALITAYLGKRQSILASAIGTVQSLRSAQTNSFQAGLDQNFFDHKERNKRQFLNNLQGMFN